MSLERIAEDSFLLFSLHTYNKKRMDDMKKQKSLPVAYVENVFASIVLSIVLLLFVAFLLYKTNLSSTALSVLLVLIYILTNFVGGLRMGKAVEKRQFLWGLLVGLGYFAIFFVASFVGNQFFMGDIGRTVLVFFLCSFSGMFGGMLS